LLPPRKVEYTCVDLVDVGSPDEHLAFAKLHVEIAAVRDRQLIGTLVSHPDLTVVGSWLHDKVMLHFFAIAIECEVYSWIDAAIGDALVLRYMCPPSRGVASQKII
jgi:hypothetical protein